MKLGRTITYLTKIVSIRYLIVKKGKTRYNNELKSNCVLNVSFDNLSAVLFGLLV